MRHKASRKQQADCSRRELAINVQFVYPTSIFDPGMIGQRLSFGEIENISNLHEYMS